MSEFLKVIVSILILVGIFFAGYYIGKKESGNAVGIPVVSEIHIRDTLRLDTTIIKYYPTIIEKTGEPVTFTETYTITTMPFVACDSLLTEKNDSIHICFNYPSNKWNWRLKYKPDTNINKMIVLGRYIEIEKKEDWWVHPAWLGGGLVGGFLLGIIK